MFDFISFVFEYRSAWGFLCNSQNFFVEKKKETYAWPVQFFTRGNDLVQKRKAWEWRLKFLAFSRMTKTVYGATEGKYCVQGQ